jgi:hypothetical protein
MAGARRTRRARPRDDPRSTSARSSSAEATFGVIGASALVGSRGLLIERSCLRVTPEDGRREKASRGEGDRDRFRRSFLRRARVRLFEEDRLTPALWRTARSATRPRLRSRPSPPQRERPSASTRPTTLSRKRGRLGLPSLPLEGCASVHGKGLYRLAHSPSTFHPAWGRLPLLVPQGLTPYASVQNCFGRN